MGRDDLRDDPRFASNADRLANREALTALLDEEFSKHPMAHWQQLLAGFVPVAPVYELGDALDNPWLETIGMRTSVMQEDKGSIDILASPIKLDGQRLANRAAPKLGADSEAILEDLGYSQDAISQLRAGGVI